MRIRNIRRRELSLHSDIIALTWTMENYGILPAKILDWIGLDHHDYGTTYMAKLFDKNKEDNCGMKMILIFLGFP